MRTSLEGLAIPQDMTFGKITRQTQAPSPSFIVFHGVWFREAVSLALFPVARPSGCCGWAPVSTPELTRGNRTSQSHELTGRLTSKVNFHYQWLQLPNPTARRRI